jgi:WD40 repeat protein/tRNA A-37 threonylcarbamoyl transferase component Bud32
MSAAAPAVSALSGRSEGFGLALDDPLDLAPGSDLGGAAILRLLGEGGMGRVYEARQTAPDRLVAVKVLRDAIASREQLIRFTYEAEVLGRLRHPGIAQIHAAGAFRHGPITVPFIIMELVAEARPITEYARGHELGPTARVALFRGACDAVAHGHRKGVVHRDLKPANILVDAAGDPKVIDFGVARSTATDPARSGHCTVAGQLVGTLAYMSPEQLDGRVDDVDARSDVYALGLVLHELLVGDLPPGCLGRMQSGAGRPGRDTGSSAAAAVERAATAAGGARSAARSLAAIVAACLAPAAADRYATAGEVTAELDRWLAGEPVLARPQPWLEAIARLARRHRVATVAVGVAALAIVAAVVGTSQFAIDAARQAAAARAELYAANVLLAAEARDRDALPEARRRLDAARGLTADSGSRQPVELGLIAAALDDSVAVATGHDAAVLATAFSPDGGRLATGAHDGGARIVPLARGDRGAERPVELVGHDGEVWRVAWSPDGTRVATASADKTARVWDAATGRELFRLDAHEEAVYGLDFSRDGAVVATAGADKAVRLWDAATGAPRGRLEGHGGSVYSVSFSAAGRRVVTGSQDGTVKIWDVARREPVQTLEGHGDWVFQAAFSPDETRIASASRDGTVRLWRASDGKVQATLRHPFRVNSVAFTPDGRHVVTASHDGVLRMFTASRGKEVWRGRGHGSAIWTVTSAAEGGMVATGSDDGTARLWITDGTCLPVVEAAQRVRAIDFSPDGATLAVAGEGSALELLDARTLLPRGRVTVAGGAIKDVGFFADGAMLAAACADGTVRVASLDSRRPGLRIPCHGRAVFSVAFTRDGKRMATASEDRTASIRTVASWESADQILRHDGRVYCARFSPDGSRLYTACSDRRAYAWDATTGRRLASYAGHDRQVNWLAVSADGGLLATASSDRTVRLWRAADAALLHRLVGPSHQVWKVAFSPETSRVAAVSADGAVHLWDVASGRPLPVLRGHADETWAVAFAPDGRTLASGSWDKTVKIHGLAVAEVFRSRQARGPSLR